MTSGAELTNVNGDPDVLKVAVVQTVGDSASIAAAATVPTDAIISVGSTSTPIVGLNINRSSILIKNIDTQTVYLYTGGAATTSKFPLAAGDAIIYRNQLAITGIVSSGSANVYVIEEQR